jgi:membrane protease YdiL (CAAX protease family)
MTEKEDFDSSMIPEQSNPQVPWKVSDVIFTYFLIFALSLVSIGILLTSGINTDTSLFPAILQIVLSGITVTTIFVIIKNKYKTSFRDSMGIWPAKFPNFIFTGIFVSFLLVISTSLVSFSFSELGSGHEQNPYVNPPQEKLRILSLLAVFIAPAVEEIFFRGFMQPALIKNLGAFGGILLTALIFGFSHSQYFNYSVALIAVIVIGLILGTTRYYTNSVIPGMVAHLLNNLFAAMSLH